MDVELTDDASEQMLSLPPKIYLRMGKLILRLKEWPNVSGVKPLRGNLAGSFRLRTGDYRVQFHLKGEVVVVEKIGHRDGFYEE
ncbi:MAG: type II toxin-antitoxin system RelE/ParE family toxin [Planctomycetaceae bacterium]|nr:type II toxin-antitoxin system RelE/ParE family toxin [Planctomycetaceae bacterium]